MLTLLAFFACASNDPIECPACDETISAPSAAGNLSDWELSLLQEPLEDIRAGIRPFGEESFGICRGVQKCEEFIGKDPGVLNDGDHMVYAELRVPKLGEQWQADFSLNCETAREDGTSQPYEYNRSYSVSHSGPNRGYRLAPMARIQSPNTTGKRECSYSLTPVRPDGERLAPMTGTFTVKGI